MTHAGSTAWPRERQMLALPIIAPARSGAQRVRGDNRRRPSTIGPGSQTAETSAPVVVESSARYCVDAVSAAASTTAHQGDPSRMCWKLRFIGPSRAANNVDATITPRD
jgi:hypothetical protein